MRHQKNTSAISVSPLKYFGEKHDVQKLFSFKKVRCEANQGSCSPFAKAQRNIGAKTRVSNDYYKETAKI